MELLTPKLGLFLWTLIVFLLFFFVLAKFAWKPILKALKDREVSIENALQEATKAREEMAKLKNENEKLLNEARDQRDAILKEARTMRDTMITKAKDEATEEGRRLLDAARQEIQAEKMRALTEIKNQVGKLSLEIAEKVLRKQLQNSADQTEYVDKLVKDIHLN